MRAGFTAALTAVLAAIVGGGCSTAPEDRGRESLRVYVSAPLRGPAGQQGRAIRDGAGLALGQHATGDGEARPGIRPRFLDDTGGPGAALRWTPGAVARNARRATSDSAAIAYLGELASGATRVSLPITNGARLLQLSPASTAVDLASPFPGSDAVPERVQPGGERTFARVIPDDQAQAGAGAAWARELGARTALVVSDGSPFGDLVAGEFAEQAGELGIALTEARGASVERHADGVVTGPQAALVGAAREEQPDLVYYGGEVAGAPPLLARVAGAAPRSTIMATDALLHDRAFVARTQAFESRLALTAAAQDPSQLPREGRRFVRRYRREYGHRPDPYAAYGYEAAALVLDAISRAGEGAVDREAIVDAVLATRDRESILGTYSIDEVGDTTLDRVAGYRVRGRRPVFAASLRAP